MLELAAQMETTIAQFVHALPDTRGRITANYDEDGAAHLKGAVDTRGYVACNADGCRKAYPCRKHGAHGNPKRIAGRSIEPTQVAYGYTRADVCDLRKSLQDIGITLTRDAAESALLNARDAIGRGTMAKTARPDAPELRRARERRKKAKRRDWARAHGICIICVKNPATDRADGTAGTTCWPCQERVKENRKNRRTT